LASLALPPQSFLRHGGCDATVQTEMDSLKIAEVDLERSDGATCVAFGTDQWIMALASLARGG
jgi:hypothetical protein